MVCARSWKRHVADALVKLTGYFMMFYNIVSAWGTSEYCPMYTFNSMNKKKLAPEFTTILRDFFNFLKEFKIGTGISKN